MYDYENADYSEMCQFLHNQLFDIGILNAVDEIDPSKYPKHN